MRKTRPQLATERRVPRVLFVCVHNAGRSQMAAAFFNALAQGRAVAISAGTQPAARVHPEVVVAMREAGLDLVDAAPQLLTEGMLRAADRVITMGCSVEDACPAALVPHVEDWGLPDPAGQPLARVREIRDTVRERVAGLFQVLVGETAGTTRGEQPTIGHR